MTLDSNPTESVKVRAPLAPPGGFASGVKAVFWNSQELRAGWRLLIFLLFVFLIFKAETVLWTVLHFPQLRRGDSSPTSLLAGEGIRLFAVLAAAAIMGFLEGRPFGGYGLPRAAAFGARFWQGIAWGISMITAILLVIRLLGGFSFGTFALQGAEALRYGTLWGVVFLFVGLFEESLFRGYAQFTLATGIGFWPAATALSAIFGAVHLSNGGEDKIGALSVSVFAMFACLTLRRTGNLWFAVGLHAAFDWGETFLYSVPDSGLVAPGHLLNSMFHGPAWLTGGTVGPEGSIMAFVFLALGSLIFARIYPSRTGAPAGEAGFSLSALPNQTENKTN